MIFLSWSYPMNEFNTKTDTITMRNILMPTDFSNNAYHALHYATELLKQEECHFFLMNAYGQKKGFKGKILEREDDNGHGKLKKVSQVKLKRKLEKIKKSTNNPKHIYTVISKSENLMQSVHLLIDELKIDLMVLGAKGVASSIPIYLGSIAQETLRSVEKCPILIVPKGTRVKLPKEIAFATDFKKSFDNKVLDPVRDLALLCGADLRTVHIKEKETLDDSQSENKDALLAYFAPLAHSVDKVPNFVSKTKILQLFMENSDIDLLAMVNYKHGVLEKMLREPIIENMVLKIDIPFFIVPETR